MPNNTPSEGQHPSPRCSIGTRKKPKVAIIRGDLVDLTGEPYIAVVLNQLLYWTQRVKDFDLLLEEERVCQPNCNVIPRHGWIYKTAYELNEETMLRVDRTTMRRYLSFLVENGWLDERFNPENKWDKTTQYRVNLRKLQQDLLAIGYVFSDFDLNDVLSKEDFTPSNGQNSSPLQKSQENPTLQNTPSKLDDAPSKEETPLSNVTKSPCIYLTEITTEITNREHTHRTRELDQNPSIDAVGRGIGVCEVFEKPLEKKEPQTQRTCPQLVQQRHSLPLSEAMVQLWKKHVCQEVLTPTKRRSHLLETALQLHFEHDLKRWEAFCKRIKCTPFLTGQGPNGWWISLDWLLREGNMLKVLEGNFDSSEVHEKQQAEVAKTDREVKMQAILERIDDSVWKDWCTQLAFPPPLPPGWRQERIGLFDLEDIAKARFMEFDGRVVVVETTDKRCHSRIQDLRLQILPVIQKAFPTARSINPQLIEQTVPTETEETAPSHPQHFNHNKGEIYE